MSLEKPKRERDEQYLAYIREQDCLVCGECEGIEAHHVREEGHGGTGTKPSDRRTVPLCTYAHLDYHAVGRAEFEKQYNLDLEKEIQRLNLAYRPIRQKKQKERSAKLKIIGVCAKGHETRVPLSKLQTKKNAALYWCQQCQNYIEVA